MERQLSPSVFTHLSSRSVRALVAGTGEKSLLVPVDPSEYWDPHLELRCIQRSVERLTAGMNPVKNQVEIINPSETIWNMNDSCRALLLSGGTSRDPPGKVHCSGRSQRWIHAKKQSRPGTRTPIWANKDKSFLSQKLLKKGPIWRQNERKSLIKPADKTQPQLSPLLVKLRSWKLFLCVFTQRSRSFSSSRWVYPVSVNRGALPLRSVSLRQQRQSESVTLSSSSAALRTAGTTTMVWERPEEQEEEEEEEEGSGALLLPPWKTPPSLQCSK